MFSFYKLDNSPRNLNNSLALARVQGLVATQRIAELAPVGDMADLGATMDAQGLYSIR